MVPYVVISPVKDEERYVELTLRSMIAQRHKPVLWVIVDDGSRDRTAAIAARYASEHEFIRVVRTSSHRPRQPGGAVIEAFNHGYAIARELDFEYVVKLDSDLSFEADYFERLIASMEADKSVGIASGVYLELNGDQWRLVSMPAYHAFGASKVVRRVCFERIGGFVPAKGWDTIDEIRAMTAGWKTGHYPELITRHHKREGSGIGLLRTNVMHGQIFWVTGGDPLFLMFKALRRMTAAPYLVGGAALLFGYLRALATSTPRLVTSRETEIYRRMLRRRLLGQAQPSLAGPSFSAGPS